MVLLVMHLFQSLPHFVPKALIEFPCILREKVCKTLELNNPFNKVINYWITKEGSNDFDIEDVDEISINPKSSIHFPIWFASRLSTEVRAKLTFTSKGGEGATQAAALVFELVSNVYSKKSE